MMLMMAFSSVQAWGLLCFGSPVTSTASHAFIVGMIMTRRVKNLQFALHMASMKKDVFTPFLEILQIDMSSNPQELI